MLIKTLLFHHPFGSSKKIDYSKLIKKRVGRVDRDTVKQRADVNICSYNLAPQAVGRGCR